MKNKTAALYDLYLDTLGGGEKYLLSILKVLSEEGYSPNIFWDKDLSSQIANRLSLHFDHLEFLPNIFQKSSNKSILKKFDYFFYVTDGSYFASSAKHNFIYAMIPQKNLYNMNLINRIKTVNCRFIAHSKFTQDWLKRWGIKSQLLYPYVDLFPAASPKEKMILSVGRFFKHLHSKRQDLAIKYFRQLKQEYPQFQDFRLILAGGLKAEDQAYFEEILKLAADDDSIILKPNISHANLAYYYQKSLFYWHFAGYGVNDEKNPELVEHMGITPLEAMVSGDIVLCYQAGGPKEIITDGQNGFLFTDGEELINKMLKIVGDDNLQKKIADTGIQFVKNNFSYKVFKNNVKKIILND